MKRSLVLTLALAACSSEAEQFVVVVDTDLTIPEDAIGIDVLATSQGGASADGVTFPLPETALPISLGVLPPEDGSPLVVEVTALDDAGNDVVLRRAIVGFEPVGRMRIPMFIASSCRGVACGESETCTEVGCAPAQLSPDQVGSVQPEDAETALCRPGPGQCNGDLSGYEVCERYGDTPVVVICGPAQHCDTETVECVDDTTNPADTVTLQVNKVGGGAGYVAATSGGIDCGATCAIEVKVGTRVTLQATPDSTSTFIGWEAAPCSGIGDCSFIVMNATNLDARFEPRQANDLELQVNLHGGAPGRIYSDPPGVDCRASMCTGSFPANTRVTLRHEAGTNAGFAGWFGDCGGVDVCVVVMDGPRWVAGSFLHDDGSANVELLVGWGGTGTGHITSLPAGIDCGTQCFGLFPRGASVELFATPEPGGTRFIGWEGACTGTGSCVVDMATSREVYAMFEADIPIATPRDLNGDGAADLVFGSPGVDVGSQPDVGRVYVVFGPKAQATMGIAQVDRAYQGAAPDSGFGASIATGDLDGDGYEDLAIGAPGENGHGAVYILFGGPGLVGSGVMPAGGPVLAGLSNGDAFGASLAIADLDVDGIGDLIVGAPGATPGSVGQVFVYAGEPGFWPTTSDSVAHLFAQSPGTEFGRSVAMIGDVDDDGWPDLAVGEPKFAPASVAEGRVALYMAPAAVASPTAPTFTLSGGSDAEAYGWSITGLYDFNRDGLEDFAVASPVKDMVHVYYGRTAWTSNVGPDLRLSQLGMFGSSIAGGHDVTGDGFPDLVVGAPAHLGSSGRVYVYEGTSTPSTQPYRVIEGTCVNAGNCDQEALGTSVDVGADVDGDYVADVVVGSRFGGGAAGQPDRGRITSYPLLAYPMSGPIPSGNADIMVVGEDQPGAMCAALPGSSPIY